ncbi:MAG: hypothetical protein WC437_02370 [Patescibacteria group bacterium]|jgi:hypothetical protein|nr:hypothetical protein [Patescibacteria group bacterium]
MDYKKIKLNIIDLIALALIIMIISFGFWAVYHKNVIQGQPTILTFTTTNNVDTLFPEAVGATSVFFNSVNKPVKVMSVAKSSDNKELAITLLANGQIDSNKYIFNGTRVAIGQKAEIHGTYFTQGIIKDIKYEK